MPSLPVAFYSVVDSRHFLGAVAMVNSLRLAGHTEPVFLADCGLEAWQRELLEQEAMVAPGPSGLVPHFLKGILPLERPAEVMVLLDADVIVVRGLAPLIDAAGAGRVAAFADPVDSRFHPEWDDLLPLGPLKRLPYVNAGLLALPRDSGSRILGLISELQQSVDLRRTSLGAGSAHDPFFYLDQDLLNAVLARPAGWELEVLPSRLAPHPPFSGLEVVDARALTCRYDDGIEPLALHHVGRKPWLHATRSNAYSRFLTRLLLAADLPIRLEPGWVPLRLRGGLLAAFERRRSEAQGVLHSQRGRLGLRRWLAARRAA
jgi:hypothetical protein